jgi:hypothetical protein
MVSILSFSMSKWPPSATRCFIPFPYQYDLVMYENEAMDLTSVLLRSM